MFRPCLFIALLVGLLLIPEPAGAIALHGTVLDRDGNPVDGANVYISQNRNPQRVQSGAQGRFHVDGLEVGRVEVVAEKTGFAIGGIEATIVGDADVALRLPDPQETRLRVMDKRGATVTGARIKTMFVGDRFHVSVEDLVPLGFPSYRSDDQGYLTVPDLPKGSYVSMVVEHRDYADFKLVTFPVGRELSLPMSAGRTVRGRILASDNVGVARARVALFRYGAGGRREFAEVLTDPEGFFVATVEPGDYYIAVNHAEHASPPPVPVRVPADGEEPTGEIVMLPPRHLAGSVAFPDGKPAPATPVAFVIDQVIVAESWTQTNGRFELLIPPVAGLVRVEPPRGYYVDQLVTAHLEHASRGEASPIVLKPLPRIRGVVHDSDGGTIANALVASQNLAEPIRVLTDAAGAFDIALDAVPFQESLKFRVDHPLRARRQEFEVDIDRNAPVNVKLESYTLKVEPDDAPKRQRRDDAPTAPGIEWANQLGHMVNKPAPEWQCDTWFNSEPITLAGLRGKVVVLALWGGFPADNGVPDAIREANVLHTMLRDVDDVVFVGIHDNGKEPDEIRAMLEQEGIEFPVGRDDADSHTLDAYNVVFIPQIVVIDQRGHLRYYRTPDRLLELIKALRRTS